MRMTELGETKIADADARAVVNSISGSLRNAGQIAGAADPGEILDELSKRHVLLVSHQDEVTFRFQHQQFQEFYAAGGLGRLRVRDRAKYCCRSWTRTRNCSIQNSSPTIGTATSWRDSWPNAP